MDKKSKPAKRGKKPVARSKKSAKAEPLLTLTDKHLQDLKDNPRLSKPIVAALVLQASMGFANQAIDLLEKAGFGSKSSAPTSEKRDRDDGRVHPWLDPQLKGRELDQEMLNLMRVKSAEAWGVLHGYLALGPESAKETYGDLYEAVEEFQASLTENIFVLKPELQAAKQKGPTQT